MMDLLLATSGDESQSASGGYVDDVFSAYTYTGNGATQTINNGIDLAGKGGLVWGKNRAANWSHYLADTSQGSGRFLSSNTTGVASIDSTSVTAFNSNGFSIGDAGAFINNSGVNYASWTFRKAPKFFDVVTYTGDGTSNRQIAHSLGVAPGMVIVKRMDGAGSWRVFHASIGANKVIFLEDTSAAVDDTGGGNWGGVSPTASSFTTGAATNIAGATYVTYLFAHDPRAEGIIQCGSFTTDGSGNATVNLGWEPQYLMVKSSSHTDSWLQLDTARGWNLAATQDARLYANSSAAETLQDFGNPTATGFYAEYLGASRTIIYLAIRRPNKPPTSGTQVYNAIARTGTGAAATVTGVGFAPDLVMCQGRTPASITEGASTGSRLQGVKYLKTQSTNAEVNNTPDSISLSAWLMNGIYINGGASDFNDGSIPSTYINHFFRRAPGFFDVVCDTGTGAAHAIAHNLTKAPELIIRKSRSAATQWEVWHSALAATEKLVLNSNAAKATDATAWGSTLPTATQFTVGTGANVNASAATFVTYLFATLAGISKVGSYTGNGSSQTIDCGFSTGARFFLVKATSATGSWWVYDSARGIVSAADPALQLNSTAAEITSADAVDPASVGIIVNQEATCSINATGVSYIFLAIA